MEITAESMRFLAKAIAIVGTGIATAWGEKVIGTAAIGAMVENENLFVKGLIMTVLPETIVIFGLVVAIIM
ncbi:V-type ATP synthase subunit K [Methanolapillus millepedarum]|uniref:V-ATPase proteolipid subunit C-like domain-containing protein n=1 Tax=Methanolapillus millepedarum TaxID=3028296 RepID=A0AA96V5F2_9EURY|nr:hypothetical protein MsAc7_14550 [Methanosarcinaceae archaeon Ac7]